MGAEGECGHRRGAAERRIRAWRVEFGDGWPVGTMTASELAVGVGMRPGTGAAEIVAAVRNLLGEGLIGSSAMEGELRIGCLATVDRRAEEPGVVAAAAQFGVPVVAFTAEELAAVVVPNPSLRTTEALGTPSVAEAAALLAAGSDRLVVGKCVVGGITVAAAVIRD